MIPGINSRDMQKAMKRLGIKQEELEALEVIIRTADSEIIISDPHVSKVNMMGQETFQVSGVIDERPISSEPDISEEDVKTVMEQTGAAAEKAREAIARNKGDLAGAIMYLKE